MLIALRPPPTRMDLALPLQLTGAKRIADLHIAALKARLEPAHALGRRTVREALRHDMPLRLPLDHVVTDLARGVQSFLDVAGL